MFDAASYTGCSDGLQNTDVLLYDAQADSFTLAICGGGAGTSFAEQFAESVFKKLKASDTADTALGDLAGERAGEPALNYCALKIQNGSCSFSAFGSIRLYSFSNGTARLLNADGSQQNSGTFRLAHEDALLVCSDGFRQNISEPEMEIGLLKADRAQDWLDEMMIRLMRRRPADGDSFTAFVLMYHEGIQGENENEF
jgi:hypothetical protein